MKIRIYSTRIVHPIFARKNTLYGMHFSYFYYENYTEIIQEACLRHRESWTSNENEFYIALTTPMLYAGTINTHI